MLLALHESRREEQSVKTMGGMMKTGSKLIGLPV